MRRTFNDLQVLHTEDNQLLGVVLGYDYCAEHEWGIKGIKRDFGIPEKPTKDLYGIHARTITRVPATYVLRDDKKSKTSVLGPVKEWGDEPIDKRPLRNEIGEIYKGQPFAAAWNENGFAIRMRKEDRPLLIELQTAMSQLDLAIFNVARTSPFGGSGLALIIASRASDENRQTMAQGDLDNIELQEAAQATGIHAKLAAADKRYHALSPRWKDESKSEVIFWLNPTPQDINNYGWFSVADLEAWARNEGPIPKQPVSR